MSSISDKTLAYLQDIFPMTADVKTLSMALGVNQNTLRGMLPRLTRRGEVQREGAGWYKATKPRKPAESAT